MICRFNLADYKDPTFLALSMLYSPTRYLYLLRTAHTKSPLQRQPFSSIVLGATIFFLLAHLLMSSLDVLHQILSFTPNTCYNRNRHQIQDTTRIAPINYGLNWVVLFLDLLKANSTYSEVWSHIFTLLPTELIKFPKLQLTTFVYPSIMSSNLGIRKYMLSPILLRLGTITADTAWDSYSPWW